MASDLKLDACWNRIGVRGDGSCPKLEHTIHCRNCPVFSAAARTVLDAPAPVDFLDLATEHFGRPEAAAAAHAAASEAHSVIVFRVCAEWFAIRTEVCLEVVESRPIHPLPHRRDGAVLGIANVRGGLLVCISLAVILGVVATPEAASGQTRRGAVTQRLLVARGAAGPIVFPVDEIHGMERFAARDFTSIPATLVHAPVTYTQGLLAFGERSVGLLDEKLLFYTVERSFA
jgi:chemotaxis-related protein WspD